MIESRTKHVYNVPYGMLRVGKLAKTATAREEKQLVASLSVGDPSPTYQSPDQPPPGADMVQSYYNNTHSGQTRNNTGTILIDVRHS